MPPLIGAAAVFAGTLIAGATLTTAIILTAMSIGVSLLSSALAPKSKRQGGVGGAGESFRQQTISVRDPVASRKIIFGRIRVGGTITFIGSNNDSAYFHEVVVFAGHHCKGIKEIYFDDDLAFDANGVIQAKYIKDGIDLVDINKHLGEIDQAADTDLIERFPGKWTINHRGHGICYLYAMLIHHSEVYTTNPNITAINEGWDEIYDPRDTTYKWTDNPVLCVAKYLNAALGAPYGTEIDTSTLIASANICDELVAIPGGTEKRYTLNGLVDTAEEPRFIIEKMLSAMAGRLIYSGGKWYILAGAYETPAAEATFNEADLRGNLAVQPRISKRDLFNAVKGVFVCPENKWQPGDFPAVASDVFMAEDNGERIWTDIELPFTISGTMAQRLGKIFLYSTREQISFSASFSLKALKVKAGETIKFSNTRMGWTDKVFLITGWEFTSSDNEENPELLVRMELRETSSAVYDMAADEYTLIASAPDTDLPSPWDYCSKVENVEIIEELYGTKNNLLTKLKVSFDIPNRCHHSEIWISKDNITYSMYQSVVQSYCEISRVDESQTYWIKIVPVNRLNIKRPFDQCLAHYHFVFGKTAKPADISEFWADASIGGLRLSWSPVADIDLDYYLIKWASGSGAVWGGAIEIAKSFSTSKSFPSAKSGKYFIKAVDTTANESVNALTVITNIPAILDWNVQETLTENPTFEGTKTDMFVDAGVLYLGSTGLFDSDVMFDSDLDFDWGENGVAAVGYYETDAVDLGSVQSSRCSLSFEFSGINCGEIWDSDELVDSDEMVDEDANLVGIIPQIALSQNGVSWGDWQNFFIGDYIARVVKFRIKAFSNNINQYLGIAALGFNVDMPDRIEAGQDVVVPSIGSTITFSKSYMAKPKIGITIQSANDGDRYVLGAVTADDFAIQIKNGASGVEKTIDWEARGY